MTEAVDGYHVEVPKAMITPRNLSRRRLLKAAGASVAVAFTTRSIQAAEELPPLEEDDSNAEALNYVADSGSQGKRCGVCEKFNGHPNDSSGPCTVFPENAVMSTGWCSDFVSVPQ